MHILYLYPGTSIFTRLHYHLLIFLTFIFNCVDPVPYSEYGSGSITLALKEQILVTGEFALRLAAQNASATCGDGNIQGFLLQSAHHLQHQVAEDVLTNFPGGEGGGREGLTL